MRTCPPEWHDRAGPSFRWDNDEYPETVLLDPPGLETVASLGGKIDTAYDDLMTSVTQTFGDAPAHLGAAIG
jgi:hypothetical protein